MRWVLGMKELARIRECVKIGEIFFGLKEKRGCKGERGDGREERERWSEFEESFMEEDAEEDENDDVSHGLEREI